VQCLHRWQKVLNPELVKGPWTKDEDAKIIELVGELGRSNGARSRSNSPGVSANSVASGGTTTSTRISSARSGRVKKTGV